MWLSPENAERIANLARSKQISYSKALALLLDTEDAAKICAPVKIDWRERVSNAPDSLKCLEKGLIKDKHRSKKNQKLQRPDEA